MGKGGVHCGSPYLYSMKGKGGVQAQCNLDMLDSMAFTLNGLVGPWILGGDWNCTPQELADTGWLQKVGGTVHAPDTATCNDSTYDFFVVKTTIADGVVCTRKIGDAGFTPHSPARLVFKGISGRLWCGRLKSLPVSRRSSPMDLCRSSPLNLTTWQSSTPPSMTITSHLRPTRPEYCSSSRATTMTKEPSTSIIEGGIKG